MFSAIRETGIFTLLIGERINVKHTVTFLQRKVVEPSPAFYTSHERPAGKERKEIKKGKEGKTRKARIFHFYSVEREGGGEGARAADETTVSSCWKFLGLLFRRIMTTIKARKVSRETLHAMERFLPRFLETVIEGSRFFGA